MLSDYNKVLVTGGAGFIGSHIVQKLLELDKEVVVFDSLHTGLKKRIPSAVTFIKGDIRESKQLPKAFKGVDLVIHAAANANGSLSITDPKYDFGVNAIGTLNVLDAAVKAKVKRFVYISSASVYGKPLYSPIDEKHSTELYMPYGGSKYVGEIYCYVYMRAYGLPMVIGRPFVVYGSGENPKTALGEVSRYLRWHLNKKPIQIIGNAKKKIRDFVHVSDTAKALLILADRGKIGEPYNIGSGTQTSMMELVKIIGNVTGSKPKTKIFSDILEDTYSLTADISKLKELGYMPKASLEDVIKQLAEELGDHPDLPGIPTIFHKGQQAESI